MKKIILGLTILTSFSAFAISDTSVENICFKKGKEKIIAQAQSFGCEIDEENIYVEDISYRWYNPNVYIWYQAEVVDGCKDHRTILKPVVYLKGDCF